MALNLSKKENGPETNKPVESKKSSLNLSKKDSTSNNEESPEVESTSNKGKLGFILTAAVIVIFGIWFFNSKNGIDNENISSSATSDSLKNKDSIAQEQLPSDSSKESTALIEADNTISNSVETAPVANSTISFDPGSSIQSSIDNSLVSEIKERIKKNSDVKIILEGYASSEGDLDFNINLSQKRANTLKEYLITKGIPEKNIVAKGMGIENPIASNDTEIGRKKNRRVEIK